MTDDELDQRVRAAVLSEQVDTARLERSIRERIRRPLVPRWAFAAAAGIALVIAGGVAYRALVTPQTPPICVAAAQDHQREIVNGEPRPWLSDGAAIQSLAEKQGVPASAIPALATTGYRLERARLCFLKKQIFLHLVYTKDGSEYSVYLRPPSGLFEGSVRGEQTLAYFETSRVTAVFVSQGADALAFARAGARVL
jgi:anti-sigma factor RsiW